ncbi:7-carboxy-7-deazaguanine synthase QueE [Cystobacter fuscus]
MLGSNPRRRQEVSDGQQLWVQEAFYTLQGEGPFSGQPAVFVRMSGCNLCCFWCDTEFESSTWCPSLDELVARVESLRPLVCDLVVITGGEPLRQNIAPFVEQLLERGLRVQIETSGSLFLNLPEHPRLFIICSPKTPRLHPLLVPRISAFKYVLAAREVAGEDGLPVMSTQKPGTLVRLARPPPSIPVFVMPRDDREPERNRANLRECTRVALSFGYTLSLQTHKLLEIS